MPKRSAFTIVEILVVLVVMTIIMSLMIPGMIRLRVISNHALTIKTLKTISNACQLYWYEHQEFPTDDQGGLKILSADDPPYLGSDITEAITPEKAIGGYYYIYQSGNGNDYSLGSRPANYGITGKNSYLITKDQIIYFTEEDRSPTLSDEVYH